MKPVCLLFLFFIIICLRIPAQNVGIGTANPATRLDVNGSFKVSAEYISATRAPAAAQTFTMINASTLSMSYNDSIGRVYDPGGAAGNYIANLSANFLVNENNVEMSYLELQIESIGLGTGDSLIIYDGAGTTSPVLYRLGNTTNTNLSVNFSSNSGYCVFKSNGDASTGPGFSLLFKRKYINPLVVQPVTTGNGMVFYPLKGSLKAGLMNADVIGKYSIATGRTTTASGDYSTAMGFASTASGNYSTAMGFAGTASGYYSTVMGFGCTASNNYAVAMGYQNVSSAYASTAMGSMTNATEYASTAMGSYSTASGHSSTAMGSYVRASGSSSVAMGSYVTAGGDGSFALGDHSVSETIIFAVDNRMNMRFAGGYRLYTNATRTTGAIMNNGDNSWSTISDSTKKENYLPVAGKNFLSKIAGMQLGSWNYKGQDKKIFRHYGPMAQEFYRYFGNDGMGTIGNDTTIAGADIDGVMMISIQELAKENERLKTTIQKLEARLEKLELRLNAEGKNTR